MRKEFKGTKGKWVCKHNGYYYDIKLFDEELGEAIYSFGSVIENKYIGIDKNVAEANARLIASAPELLEALQEMDKDLCVLEGTMTAIEKSDHLADGMTDFIKKWRERGQKAINKALGL